MRVDTARCSGGCGVIVQLPSLKARAYSAKCEACVRKAQPASALKAHTREPMAPGHCRSCMHNQCQCESWLARKMPVRVPHVVGGDPDKGTLDVEWRNEPLLSDGDYTFGQVDAMRYAMAPGQYWGGGLVARSDRHQPQPVREVHAEERERIGREKNARIDACRHDFIGAGLRCNRCEATPHVIATRMERSAKTQIDVARLNVFRLESQLIGAAPQEQRGINECLTAARAELIKLNDAHATYWEKAEARR